MPATKTCRGLYDRCDGKEKSKPSNRASQSGRSESWWQKGANTWLETLEVISMAATTINIDWAALAKTLWPRAQITGTGANAVVNRCHFPHVNVSLFEAEAEARAHEAGLCCPSCNRKHTFGNIERFAPAQITNPAPVARIGHRRNASLIRWMTE